MFQSFSLKLPIVALILTYFGKYGTALKFKRCNPQKGHVCVRSRVLNSIRLTYFYICDLCRRRKHLKKFQSMRMHTKFRQIRMIRG